MIEQATTFTDRLNEVHRLVSDNKMDEAVLLMKEIIEMHPEETVPDINIEKLYPVYAKLCIKAGSTDIPLSWLMKALDDDPEFLCQLPLLGKIYLEQADRIPLKKLHDFGNFIREFDPKNAEKYFYKTLELDTPTEASAKKYMRKAFENREEALDKGNTARKKITERYNWNAVSKIIVDRVNSIIEHGPATKTFNEPNKQSKQKAAKSSVDSVKKEPQFRLRWEGAQLVPHSLALVNREICSILSKNENCDISLIPCEADQPELFKNVSRFKDIPSMYNKELDGPADFHIRHRWPPQFTAPKEGLWIFMQPWEFGHLPADWIKPVSEQVDEIWAYSNAVKQCYIGSGIDAERVKVIPLGVNPEIFHPKTEPYPLKTKKSFKYPFIGGTIWRKGIDALLDIYTGTFSRTDDVCLVIKDMGGESFYKGMNAAERIREIQSGRNAPEIEYLTENLPEKDIAGLYTACDCLVHPYRGEGFGLPVAEAMASGIPVIVTEGGPTEDFCPPGLVYRIPSEKILVNIEIPLIKQGFALQPDAQMLREIMKTVFGNPEEARRRAEKAGTFIRENYTWEHTTQAVIERLKALKSVNRKPVRLSPEKQPVLSGEPVSEASCHDNGKNAAETLTAAEYYDLMQKGDMYFEESDYKQALPCYRTAFECMPENLELAVKCAETAVRAEEYKLAEETLETAAKASPENPDAFNTYGVFLVSRDKLEDAVRQFQKAIEIAPGNIDSLCNLAEIKFRLGEHGDAIKYCSTILNNDPDNNDIRLQMGNSLALSGRLSQARDEYRQIIQSEPGHKDALDSLKLVEEALEKAVSA